MKKEKTYTSMDIARDNNIQHRIIYNIIKSYINEFSSFGKVKIIQSSKQGKKIQGRGRYPTLYILNRYHLHLLIMLLGNNYNTVNLKMNYVNNNTK